MQEPSHAPLRSDDFDFLLGRWRMMNRRRAKWFTASDEWEEFPATVVCRSVFARAGNVDEITFPTKGLRGLSVRLFEPECGEWLEYYTDTRANAFGPPMHGRFEGGVGVLQGEDVRDGLRIHVRHVWSQITPQSVHWEQSCSRDGQVWEVNWIAELLRIGARIAM